MSSNTFSTLPAGLRALCGGAALLTTGAISAALLTTWHQAAEPVWLAATPAVLAEVAACEAEPGRFDRQRCKEAIVALRSPSGQRVYPMASR